MIKIWWCRLCDQDLKISVLKKVYFEDPKIETLAGQEKYGRDQIRSVVERIRKSDEEKSIKVGVRFDRVGSSQHVKSEFKNKLG